MVGEKIYDVAGIIPGAAEKSRFYFHAPLVNPCALRILSLICPMRIWLPVNTARRSRIQTAAKVADFIVGISPQAYCRAALVELHRNLPVAEGIASYEASEST